MFYDHDTENFDNSEAINKRIFVNKAAGILDTECLLVDIK